MAARRVRSAVVGDGGPVGAGGGPFTGAGDEDSARAGSDRVRRVIAVAVAVVRPDPQPGGGEDVVGDGGVVVGVEEDAEMGSPGDEHLAVALSGTQVRDGHAGFLPVLPPCLNM